nr:MAG TPA: hypothetical protein [Caudoviricetes sp.]
MFFSALEITGGGRDKTRRFAVALCRQLCRIS